MEVLHEYRHVLDKKAKKFFIESLKKTIKKLNLENIGFIGVIGSFEEELSHDIDVLIFSSKDAKIGEVIISIAEFYDNLEKDMKKHHERFYISCSPRKAMQEMIYYLASLQEGGAGMIPVHSLFFPDLKSFKSFNPKDFQKEIKKELITLHGNFNIIKKLRNDIPQKKLEPYFVILDFEMNSKMDTFPRHLIRTSAESLFSYLSSKYKLKIKKKKFHDIREIESELKRLLKELDKRTYN